MALKTMIDNLTKAREEYEKQKKSLGEDAIKAMCESFSAFLDKGLYIEWEQYTPYFNDGDACTFSVNEPQLYKHLCDDECDDNECDNVQEFYMPLDHNECNEFNLDEKKCRDLYKMFNSLPTDFFESVFGDHVKIRINHDGSYDVSESHHD